MSTFAFVLAFLLGRTGSALLYQATWRNGKTRRFHPWGALATFLGRPWPWLVHLPMVALTARLDWRNLPTLHLFSVLAAGSLALGAVGRLGAVDLGRLFVFDRALIAFLWLGLWLSPAFLYPLLLACCCLQYTVSGWPLQPGYSNLLGYEFIRSTLCLVLAALLVAAGFQASGRPLPGAEAMALAVVLCGQAAGYVQQALAKCALGPRWYSWILENRLQCLLVNAWLRGWGAERMGMATLLRLARRISRLRVPLCGAVWVLEAAWLFILADHRLAMALLGATTLFHLAIWASTGLAGYHYLVSHASMLLAAASPAFVSFQPRVVPVLAGVCCIAASAVWVLLLRRHLFRAYARTGGPGPWGRALDPSDHLMAWWDGPYMRMYSYSVTTASGRRWLFPVTRFSPYDTFLTDIHTHLMVLGRDWDLDPDLAADRAVVRAGVWGLTVTRADRDRVYALMDDPASDLSVLRSPPRAPAPARTDSPLVDFFRGLNRYQAGRLRAFLRRPHFPGEDMVPDASPLSAERLPVYQGSEPIVEAACHRIKTFYRGDRIERVEERIVARLRIGEARTGGEARAPLLPHPSRETV